MYNRNTKAKEILLGVVTGIGLWIFGHLLSGRLSFVEDLELYPTGPLVFAFPFVFAAASILVAKYSTKKAKDAYFKSSLICFFIPVACGIISMIFEFITELRMPVISTIADYMVLVFIFPCVPATSIFLQMLKCADIETVGIPLFILLAVNIIPMITGLIIAIKIHRSESKCA